MCPHPTLLFVVSLAVLGTVVAHQVHRVGGLSRRYEHRLLP